MAIKCCKGCENRKVGCHAKCEVYKCERRLLDEVSAQRKREKIVDSYVVYATKLSSDITKRRHGYKTGGSLLI
jgi:hypothetical protein